MTDHGRREPVSPEVEERVRASFARQGLMRHLGARLVHIASGLVQITLPSRPELTQQDGFMHAGATTAIADSAGGYAAYTLAPADTEVLTVEFKMNLLAPAVGDQVDAVGTVLRSGRTLTVCRLEVFGVQGDRRSLVATGQQTIIRVDATPALGQK